MKCRINLIALLVLFTNSIRAQVLDSILGKWKFEKVYSGNEPDSAIVNLMSAFYADATIYIKPNHHYKLFLMKKEEGEWDYNQNKHILKLMPNYGKEHSYELKMLPNSNLLVTMDTNESIIMSKSVANALDEIEETVTKFDFVSVSPKQICKKWFLQSRNFPYKPAESTKTSIDIYTGLYFNLEMNNTYQTHFKMFTEIGIWELENSGKTIYLTTKNKNDKHWNVIKATESELVLLKENSDESWTFTTNE